MWHLRPRYGCYANDYVVSKRKSINNHERVLWVTKAMPHHIELFTLDAVKLATHS